MKWLLTILSIVGQVLLTWLARRARPTAEDADPDRVTRAKLREKIRQHWKEPKP